MQMRTLGSSDLEVSVIGLGTMSWKDCRHGVLAPPDSRPDREGTLAMVRSALENGINLFDTAQSYGRGLAEELLGSALKELGKRDRAIIVTKTGPLFAEEQIKGRTCNLSSAFVRERCELSLRRLKTDYIDVLLCHWPDPQTHIDETVETMLRLQEEGKIRHFGVSNFSNELIQQALPNMPVVVNQLPYSMIDRKIEQDKLPFCREHNIAVMAYSPLGKGMLSGKYDENHLPPADDYRHQRPHFAKENLEKHLKLAQRIREISRELGVSPTQFVLAWTIAQPGLTLTIPGARSIEQVIDNARGGSLQLPQELIEEFSSMLS